MNGPESTNSNFADVVRRRRMVRRYHDRPVDTAVLDRILEAARRSPTAGHAQGIEFVVVTDTERRRRIAHAAGESAYVAKGFTPWLSVAPVHIVIAADPDRYRDRYAAADKAGTDAWNVPYWWVDAGAAMMSLLLAATAEGLGAGFLGEHSIPDLASIVGLPQSHLPLGVVTVGHAAPEPPTASAQRGRRPLDAVVHREHWSASHDL